MSDARERILARIEAAKASRASSPLPATTDPVQPGLDGDLLEVFETAAVAADTDVSRLDGPETVPDAVARRLSGTHAVGIASVPALTALDWRGAGLTPDLDGRQPAFVVEAFAGIAETGTLVLVSDDAPTPASFLADHLFVVLDRNSVTAWQETVWSRLAARYGHTMPRGVILMTGPSRTGDVEQTLQLGAHGPRALTVLMT